MKILKKIIIAIVSIVLILLIVALFTKNDYAVEREVTINKPKQEVFDYIKYVKNQQNYSKWVMMDPNMKKEFKGTDGAVGFVYSWDSDLKDVGKGEQAIKGITEGEYIDMEIHFIKPFEGRANARMQTEALSENQTKVKWGFKSKMTYPMNIMLLFMNMDDMVGNDLQTGLNNLKTVLEDK